MEEKKHQAHADSMGSARSHQSAMSSQWGLSSIHRDEDSDAHGSQPDMESVCSFQGEVALQSPTQQAPETDLSKILEQRYIQGVRKRIKEVQQAVNSGMVDPAALLAAGQIKESSGLVQAVEMAALEFIQSR